VRRDRDHLGVLLAAPAFAASVLAWSAVLGLGVSRQGSPGAIAVTATLLVYAPSVAVGATASARRWTRSSGFLVAWSLGLMLAMPVYFPGERSEAVATGLALLTGNPDGEGMPRSLAEALPEEPDLAIAQVPQATPIGEEILPAPPPIAENDIELPYEGEGRRLSIDVTFEHHGRTLENTHMMLDTGATYTTLPLSVLRDELGVVPGDDAPELTLNTANGQRTAKVVLLDRVWLGSLPLDGVAITTCEDCASDGNVGLLGLNVSGAYNLHIDADRRMVVFSQRAKFTRRLDVRPFSNLQARFVRYPGGRVEVEMDFDNRSPRTVLGASARVTCGKEDWLVELGQVEPFGTSEVRRRLPRHDRCDTYEIVLEDAWW
jgi:hypothetical protein